MSELLNQYYATDKDIFDLLMSGKQRLTESVLHELARDRGIFYSPHDTREELVERLSLLPHDFSDVVSLMHRREHSRRGEKTTSVTLDVELSVEEIREAVSEYQTDVGPTEAVTSYKKGTDGYVINVQYDEIDYSRTKLIQRQRHDAGIEFAREGDKTIVRLPATEKAQRVVAALKDKIESKRKEPIPQDVIELTRITEPDDRTYFFTKLISSLKGYRLRDVTNLRVSSLNREEPEENVDLDDERDLAAEHEMLAFVRNIALNGQNLVASAEYQQLRASGFFITSITWSAEQTSTPQDIIVFHAAFDDGERGTGFKYAVKGAHRFQEGQHTKTIRQVEDHERETLFHLLEASARDIYNELKAKYAEEADAAEEVEA